MKKNIIYTLIAFLVVACSEESVENTMAGSGVIPINIENSYPVQSATRATDNGFVADDAVGIFVVDYNSDGTPGVPMLKGNRASNTKFIYDGGRWDASYQLYWANSKTPADFYGYYPFDQSLSSVTEYFFAVEQKQDTATNGQAGYEKSDLLWSKVEKVMPTLSTVPMKYKHLMAGVTVTLERGAGFTAEEWNDMEKIVVVENTVTSGTVNLATGECRVGEDNVNPIIPLSHNGAWRAIVFPQKVAAGKALLNINVDKQSYSLVKGAATEYLSGKMHNFTITVNKNSANGEYDFILAADDILAWIDDPQLHDGLVKQYTIVKLEQAGTIGEVMKNMNLELDKITSLKVEGNVDATDFKFMTDSLSRLTNLNLLKCIIVADKNGNGDGTICNLGNPSLTYVVFPEKSLKVVAGGAFYRSSLKGLLNLPEGLEVIEHWSFEGCNFRGELKFPSTLKRLDGTLGEDFAGPLIFPDGIEAITSPPRGNFTGTLSIPSSLKEMSGYWSYPNLTGTLVIPKFMTEVGGFANGGYTNIEFHDGITKINKEAFIGSSLSGELVLPPNLKFLGGKAFAGTKITKIIFPESLKLMGDGNYNTEGTFTNCKYLMGTVTLPKNVVRLPGGCFAGCSGITGLVIPEGIDIISENAFNGCSSLNSIVCEDVEPPLVLENAFYGVNKDNFTVEVPKGCVEKYKNALGWSDFKRIAEYSNFVCRPAQANALNKMHTETLVLNADGDWEVEHCPSWITLSKTKGKGKSELFLTFTELEHGAGNRRDSILFRMPAEDHRTYCVVSQYDYVHDEDSYITLQNHSKGQGIDIMFIGDGWNGEDISNGSYLELIKEQTEHFFAIEPYKSHREYFNVHVAFPLSQESGVNTMHTYVNNKFGTLYGYIGDMCSIDRLLTESDQVLNYAFETGALKRENRWRSMIILVPNSDIYSGVTEFHNGMPLSICPPSNRPYPQDTRGVIQHEAGGHGFGRLADEEIKYSSWATPNIIAEIEAKHREGWYKNIATTSKMSQVPWADFIFDTRYSDYVDIYEGAYSYMRGVFRSESNSCMNYGIPYYNAISRLEIMKRIFDYARERFSMDYFYANDTNEWGDTDGTTRAGTEHTFLQGSSYAGSNQHNEPQFVNAKEQGTSVREIRDRLKKNNR